MGFYDGYVFVSWGGQELHAKLHNGPVTDIQISRDFSLLFSSGYDGAVKAI